MANDDDRSLNAFRDALRREVQEICERNGLNLDNNSDRGYAFQLWTAELFCADDEGFETEPDEAVLSSRDLGADVVLEDPVRKHLLIAQCKFVGVAKKSDRTVDEKEVNDFFSRHRLFCDDKWIRRNGSQAAYQVLGDYSEKLAKGYSVELVFVSSARMTERAADLVVKANEHAKREEYKINYSVLDLSKLKEKYHRSRSLDKPIPAEVTLAFPSDQIIEVNHPYRTVVGIIKGNALRDLYATHGEALFAHNIRGYLGARGINKDIMTTVEERPGHFFYFNNGISAICTSFDRNGGVVTAKSFQVINGAQTIGALWKARQNSDVRVLLRLTQAESVKTEKGINSDMIRYNNTQNTVKLSDFRANDQIQKWLEAKFNERRGHDILPVKLQYQRKRGGVGHNRTRGAKTIRLEDLAKIRYAFLYEPTLVMNSPRDLWTVSEDGGHYEDTFGEEGAAVDMWSDEAWHLNLLAIALHDRLLEETKQEAKEDANLKNFSRLRFHLLSLAGLYFQSDHVPSPMSVLKSQERFEETFQTFWQKARDTVVDHYLMTREKEDMTMYIYSLSTERFQRLKSIFTTKAKIRASSQPGNRVRFDSTAKVAKVNA